jgi:nicotinate phosphoribosyltransferase
MDESIRRDPSVSPLLLDLYQLTMLQAYVDRGMEEIAVFEFFVRRLPGNRGFLIAAGLEQALDYLEGLRFTGAEIEWLESRGFSPRCCERLAKLRFTGDVYAIPEGTVVFPNEPLLRIVAPLPEAQLVESRLINIIQFQTMVASKAARCVLAAPGKSLIDFGMRRAHGAEAALYAARASWIAGFYGSATVLAETLWDIPSSGTMAHSFIQAHQGESEAFEHFALSRRQGIVLLVDTYDTEEAVRKVVRLAPKLRAEGITIDAVRLDSGDLLELSRRTRAILDEGGLASTHIFASGGLDEYALHHLVSAGAPIDGFGVGTALDTSADAPYLDCAYKLQEYAGLPRRKRSTGKETWPGRKQVYRRRDENGMMCGDTLTLETDVLPGEALLRPWMLGGKRMESSESLSVIRKRAAAGIANLPPALRTLEPGETYPVAVSPALRALAEECDRRTGGAALI